MFLIVGIFVDLQLIRTYIRAILVPFLCFRGYRDSQNTAKAKGRARRGHGEDTKMPPRACSGTFRSIFVDLPLCGIVIKITMEHKKL